MENIFQVTVTEAEYMKAKRVEADKSLPKLGELLKKANDPELTEFMQEIVDHYMLNVCKLGRRPNGR